MIRWLLALFHRRCDHVPRLEIVRLIDAGERTGVRTLNAPAPPRPSLANRWPTPPRLGLEDAYAKAYNSKAPRSRDPYNSNASHNRSCACERCARFPD